MNKQKWLLMVVALALMAGAAGLLTRMRTHQQLAPPGVKTHPLPGSACLQVDVPEQVLDYKSEWINVDEVTSNTLPKDTSFGQRYYKASDGSFGALMNVVLMGTDRTSMHKPQFCLEGAGWHIDGNASTVERVSIAKPFSYELPVVKLIVTKEGTVNGEHVRARGIYVYWFVADDAMSASVTGFERMRMMAMKLLRTGVLQRWAYISCFAVCAPGQEDATFERMKTLIAAAVPQLQLYPKAPNQAMTARQ